MKRILVVFGTRPEAIKLAPVIGEVRRRPELFETVVCVTAQHRRMLDQVLDLFRIDVRHDLDLMHEGQDLTDLTCGVLKGLPEDGKRLVGTDRGSIVAEALRLLDDRAAREAMARAHNPYGDGRAAGRIAAVLGGY